jgi:hypothetical protein
LFTTYITARIICCIINTKKHVYFWLTTFSVTYGMCIY